MRKLQLGSPKDVAAILSRRKWWVIVPFTLLTMLTGFVALILPPIYISDTLIFIEPRDVPDDFVRDLISLESDQRLDAIRETILSRTNLISIYNEFAGQLADLRFLNDQQRLRILRGQIDIQFEKMDRHSEISHFRIYYEHKDPQLAQAITRRLAALFIEYDSKTREKQVYGTSKFFEDEAEKVAARLRQVDEALTQLKKRYRYELPEQLDTNLRTLDRLQQQHRTNAEALDRSIALRLSLERQLSETPVAITQVVERPQGRGREDSPLVREFREKEQAYNLLISKYTERHPDVRRLRSELQRLRSEIPPEDLVESVQAEAQSETYTVPNPVHQELRNQLEEVKADIRFREKDKASIEQQIRTLEVRVDNTSQREQELSALQREFVELNTQYDDLSAKLSQARLAESLESKQKGEQFRIVDPASLPLSPSKPNRPLIIFLGLVASFGVGVALAVVRDFMEQRFYNYKEVEEYFGIPILVEIPQILSQRDQRRARRSRWVSAAVFLMLMAISAGCLFWIYKTPEVRAWGTQNLQSLERLISR